ncbi:MAG: methyl-accepting chemotaxis protein [Lachnospiraceae bacterium]|nr:methyl-accepting chemotaxis protein [Lachnospiraceae bacterium]
MAKGKSNVHSLKWVIMIIVDLIVVIIGVTYGVFCLYEAKQLSTVSINSYKDAMNDGYRSEIKSQVESCITMLQGYYDKAQSGVCTEDQAKSMAKEAIRSMRYREDGSGYLWIDATDYTLIVHPILTEQEGTNRRDMQDKKGVMVTQEIVKAGQSGGGFSSFWFTKSDGKTVAEKLAYSEEFKPWGWVVATGNYVDDMQKAMAEEEKLLNDTFKKMVALMLIISVVILFFAGLAAAKFGKRIAKPIKMLESALGKIAAGDLRFDIDSKLLKRKDEIGSITKQMLEVKNSLHDMVGGIGILANQLQTDNQNFNESFAKAAESIGNISTAVEEIAEGATNQASDTEVVSNKVKDLEHVIDKEKDAVIRLEKAIGSMMDYSGGAVSNVEQLVKISDKTNHAISFVNDQTQKTNQSVGDIQQAISVITGIAEQTSLLSLNASIEAARAGEQGKGFAVVAEEIRKLADESNESASEIEKSVQQLITNSESSVDKMQDVSQNVQEQMKRLKETRDAFESLYQEIQTVEGVSEDLGVQTGRLDELKTVVADSVNSLASVIEQSAAGAQETSASMNILHENIEDNKSNLQELVDLNDDLAQKISRFSV